MEDINKIIRQKINTIPSILPNISDIKVCTSCMPRNIKALD